MYNSLTEPQPKIETELKRGIYTNLLVKLYISYIYIYCNKSSGKV